MSTRKGGFKSKCHFECAHECSHSCKKMCAVSKTDPEYHAARLEELQAIKNTLKKKISEKETKMKNVLTTKSLTETEKGEIRNVLQNTTGSIKHYFGRKSGGFAWLSMPQKHSDCETECEKKCTHSCDFTCDSVNRISSLYKKEIDVLESEIDIMRTMLKI